MQGYSQQQPWHSNISTGSSDHSVYKHDAQVLAMRYLTIRGLAPDPCTGGVRDARLPCTADRAQQNVLNYRGNPQAQEMAHLCREPHRAAR